MADLWPWLAIAGLGALHGLSPVNGWVFAAACGVQARSAAQARRALGPIALGQVASIGVLVGAVSLGIAVDRGLMRDLAGALLVGAAGGWCWRRRSARPRSRPTTARHAGLALWSFLTASAQGAGLMLIPALGPLCAPGAPVREFVGAGPLAAGLVAVVVHTAAMLLTTGLLASAAIAAQRKFLPGENQ